MVLISLIHVWLCILCIINIARCEISRPHVIFILADDLGWNDVSFHGSQQISTPNIDSLARRGVILNNYYVSPICTPSRSAIMSGKHPIHTGMQHDVIYGSQPYGFPLREKLLPQYLKDLGYVTRIVGKWHLGFFKSEYTPTQRGFDSHFGYFCGHQDYYDHTSQETAKDWGLDMRNGTNLVGQETFGKYSTELFNDEAVRIILSHNTSQPLFLYLAHLAVHAGNPYAPLQAPKRYINRFPHIKDKQRKTFAGMMAALDDSVGDVIEALYRKSMLDDVIIVFSTDNGGPAAGYNLNCANNWPLKGVKDTLWEGGVRGTGLIWSPKLKIRGRVSHQLMHVSDWLPTLYDAVGGDIRKLPADLDGFNLWPTISLNLTSPRTEVLHNIDDILHIAALRVGDYKIVIGRSYNGQYDNWFPPPQSTPPQPKSASIDFILDNYQYLQFDYNDARVVCGPVPANATLGCRSQIKPCLFNIRNDPCEFHNLADTQPQILNNLLEKLANYNKTAVPPINQPDDVRASPRFHQYSWVPWMD